MTLVRRNRDLRVDVFRGIALWWIFIDHTPTNWLNQFSLRNFALCDSTEIFVLLAGYAGGLVYGRAYDQHGWLYAGADAIRRAWTLYIAHIFLFVVFSAQVANSAALLDRADYLDEIHLDVLGESPYRAMLEALKLNFQPAYLNILPMYVAMLLQLALVLPLLRRPMILAALSLSVYTTARVGGYNLPQWTGGGWYFNPMTWQLLFTLGAIIAHAPKAVPRHPRLFDALSVAVVVMGFLLVWVVGNHPEITANMPPRLARVILSVDKEGLHPFRLVSILALAWLVSRLIPPTSRLLDSRFIAPFALMGQHSLPVFCVSVFLSFLGRIAMELDDDGITAQLSVNIIGAAVMLAVAALGAWYRQKSSAPPRALPATPRPDTA